MKAIRQFSQRDGPCKRLIIWHLRVGLARLGSQSSYWIWSLSRWIQSSNTTRRSSVYDVILSAHLASSPARLLACPPVSIISVEGADDRIGWTAKADIVVPRGIARSPHSCAVGVRGEMSEMARMANMEVCHVSHVNIDKLRKVDVLPDQRLIGPLRETRRAPLGSPHLPPRTK
jgi:hypothetical protein